MKVFSLLSLLRNLENFKHQGKSNAFITLLDVPRLRRSLHTGVEYCLFGVGPSRASKLINEKCSTLSFNNHPWERGRVNNHMAKKIANAQNPASPDIITFPGVSSQVQTQWRSIIKQNLPNLNRANTFSDLIDALNNLRISGVGTGTINRTAKWICQYNDNIDQESNCACFMLKRVISRLGGMGIKRDAICRDSLIKMFPDIADKDVFQIITHVNNTLK